MNSDYKYLTGKEFTENSIGCGHWWRSLLAPDLMSSQTPAQQCFRVQLPTETWQTILRYTISVPLFFDTDPAASYGLAAVRVYHDTSAYWDSERTRNKLRRVCSSWNIYLQCFAHRLVCLDDIIHNHVPITAIPLAYRKHLARCTCMLHYNETLDALASGITMSDLESISDQSWKVKIVKVDRWIHEPPLLTLLASKSCVQVYIRPWSEQGNPIIEKHCSSELRFYSGGQPTNLSSARNLSTLNFILKGPFPMPAMPNLRYLSIITKVSSHRVFIFDWLRHIGGQLLSFFWKDLTYGAKFSIPIWTLCPSITSLQLPSNSSLIAPPDTHPVNYLRFGLRYGRSRNHSRCIHCPLSHPIPILDDSNSFYDIVRYGNIKTASFDRSWRELLGHLDVGGAVECCYQWLKRHGIRFVDVDWLSFEDYIVQELEMARGLRVTTGILRFCF
ncbi:hypothetical protein PIIN_03208 [Serendipita indica DSM 11827]|uniref:F-box domain-containing protein n=1 Tax=Serendipita indica (strain DSM 11827) TaxID=1109443 RepID=G4TDB6_SERID|nr:hypothetical protein PIIN_03208 [Serendipita indica DSM 11827]